MNPNDFLLFSPNSLFVCNKCKKYNVQFEVKFAETIPAPMRIIISSDFNDLNDLSSSTTKCDTFSSSLVKRVNSLDILTCIDAGKYDSDILETD